MQRFRTRNAEQRDISRVVEIDRKAFTGLALPAEVFENWLKVYADGFMVAENRQNEVVAYSMAIRMHRDVIRPNWSKDTGYGWCNTHCPDGEILYGVSLASLAMAAGTELCRAERHLVENTPGVEEIHIYGRVRGFRSWKETNMPIADVSVALEAYLATGIDQIADFYDHQGLMIIEGVPEYLPEDIESLGCAVHVVWSKPKVAFRRPVALVA